MVTSTDRGGDNRDGNLFTDSRRILETESTGVAKLDAGVKGIWEQSKMTLKYQAPYRG